MVAIAQLVRAPDCDSGGRGFEPHWLPTFFEKAASIAAFFYGYNSKAIIYESLAV